MLWAEVKPLAALKKEGPAELSGRALGAWAKEQREDRLRARLDAIDAMLQPGLELTVSEEYGEIRLLGDGVPLIEGLFLDEQEAPFVAAQWRHKARRTNVTEKFDGKRLLGLLLKQRTTENAALRQQVIRLDAEIQALDQEIDQAETAMNRLTYRLYDLTEGQIRLVEGDA